MYVWNTFSNSKPQIIGKVVCTIRFCLIFEIYKVFDSNFPTNDESRGWIVENLQTLLVKTHFKCLQSA